jgi:hypothetical protein
VATLVSTWPNGTLLPAIRSTLAWGDEGLLCVAFANRKGVALLDEELSGLADRGGCRMLLTSASVAVGMGSPHRPCSDSTGPVSVSACSTRVGARSTRRCTCPVVGRS